MNEESVHMRDPLLFQGRKRQNHYFEGWYFKQVCDENGRTVSFIPGISQISNDRHAFIQVIIAPKIETYYFRFELDDFSAQDDPFVIRIANNTFSKNGMTIDLHNEQISINGSLHFKKFTPIKSSVYAPTIMGPFSYIPNMECNHGVISMNHAVSGHLMFSGESWTFDQDRGYLEKDWGTSFPRRYLWVQANHFDDPSVSFMASVADIPMMGLTFSGVIGNLIIEGTEHRFATYNGYKARNIRRSQGGYSFDLVKGSSICSILVRFDDAGELKAPQRGAMHGVIKEGLGANITVVFQGKTYTSDFGGAEFVGY